MAVAEVRHGKVVQVAHGEGAAGHGSVAEGVPRTGVTDLDGQIPALHPWGWLRDKHATPARALVEQRFLANVEATDVARQAVSEGAEALAGECAAELAEPIREDGLQKGILDDLGLFLVGATNWSHEELGQDRLGCSDVFLAPPVNERRLGQEPARILVFEDHIEQLGNAQDNVDGNGRFRWRDRFHGYGSVWEFPGLIDGSPAGST